MQVQLIIDRIDDLKESHAQRLDSIDENLKEHMRRTDVLESLHLKNEERIEQLEKPGEALEFIKKAFLYIGALSGTAYTIIKTLEYFGGQNG